MELHKSVVIPSSINDILDSEGFIELDNTYDILNNIVAVYIQKGINDQAIPLFIQMLTYLGKFANANRHAMQQINPYWASAT